ncbi:YceI family protein [bacterium]|nr:YceI family protein [bacterium]MBU1636445.1 YceI family protein [bacterium]
MKLLLPVLLLFSALNALAESTMFKVIADSKDTYVEFVSDAPLERIVGKTRTATGFVELNPQSNGSGARAEIHVDLATLDTGVKLRDRHMRDNHLETDLYPEAVFSLTSLKLPENGLIANERTLVSVKGRMKLHGKEREITPEVYLTLSDTSGESALRIESNFVILLEDYEIDRPQFLLMKLSREQQIHVDILTKTSQASADLR